jgi:GntR family transcriptional regulator
VSDVTDEAAMPLWRQVKEDLERRIASGEIAERFPTDRELVETYGVSRHTVREAVRRLHALGVIERERGRGSIVRRSRYVQPLGTLYSLFRAIEAQGIPQRSEVLAFDARPDAAAAAVFGVDPSTDLVHLERLRFAGDDPLALDTSWLHPDVGPAVLGADMTRTALYDEIERRAGRRITGGEDVVGARIPDASLRDALHLEPDEAVLRIERLGESDGRIVECRVTLVRAGLFALVMRWPTVGAIESRFDLSGDRDEAVRPASTSPRL